MTKQDVITFLLGGGATGGLYKIYEYFFSLRRMKREDYIEDQEVITALSQKLKAEVAQSSEDLMDFAKKLRSQSSRISQLELEREELRRELNSNKILISELEATIKDLRNAIQQIKDKK